MIHSARSKSSGILPIPPGFKGFGDLPKPTPDPAYARQSEVERKLGEMGSTLDATRLVKPAGVGLIKGKMLFEFRRNKAWFVFVENASSDADAKKAGLRIQKNLVAKKSLSSSDPYLHDYTLWVGYPGGVISLPPLEKKAPAKKGPNLTDLKKQLSDRLIGVLGGSVRITGNPSKGWVAQIDPRSDLIPVIGRPSFRFQTFEEGMQKVDEALSRFEEFLNTKKTSSTRIAGKVANRFLEGATSINPETGKPWSWNDYHKEYKEAIARELWDNHKKEALALVQDIIKRGQALSRNMESTAKSWDRPGSFPGNQAYGSEELFRIAKADIERIWGKDAMLIPLVRMIALGDYIF